MLLQVIHKESTFSNEEQNSDICQLSKFHCFVNIDQTIMANDTTLSELDKCSHMAINLIPRLN